MRFPRCPSLVAFIALASRSAVAVAQDATTAGVATAPHPTFHNISISWPIDGDDDADGVVSVRVRPSGGSFREVMPLFRVPAGRNEEGDTWESRHAGSIFGLEPATTYEVELTLVDPDGGAATETLSVTTRAWPEAMAGAPEIPVDPDSLAGALDAAQPGDVLVLADGTYPETYVTADGTIDAPIVLRAANPRGAVFEGDVRLDGREHVIVEGLLVRGKLKFNDSVGIVVRGNRIETAESGVVAFATGVTDGLIEGNVILGATTWAESSLGVNGDNVGEGVQITGPGNVVAFNRISGFRDCISLLEDGEAFQQHSIDIYGNDLSNCPDDGIEADFSEGNVRVYQNRIVDSFMAISSQPSLGGPTYFIRNVMFNTVYQPFKLQRGSTGDVILHNTSVMAGDAFAVRTTAPIAHAWVRNNIFIGAPGEVYQVGPDVYDAGPGDVARLATADDSSTFDHDAYGAIGVGAFRGRIGDASFESLEEMRAVTTEAHAVEVDLSIFEASVSIPTNVFDPPAAPSFALADSALVIDAGLAIVGLNDGFEGDAPDIGAYEHGQSLPEYGPGGQLGGTSSGSGSGGGDVGAGTGDAGVGPAGSGGSEPAGGGGDATGRPSGSGAGAGSSEGVGAGGHSDEADGAGDGCGCHVAGAVTRNGAGVSLLALVAVGLRRARRRTAGAAPPSP